MILRFSLLYKLSEDKYLRLKAFTAVIFRSDNSEFHDVKSWEGKVVLCMLLTSMNFNSKLVRLKPSEQIISHLKITKCFQIIS